MFFWWQTSKLSLQQWYFDWQLERSKLQSAWAIYISSVHLRTKLDADCSDNPTTSTICVCYTPNNHKVIIRSLFSREVVRLQSWSLESPRFYLGDSSDRRSATPSEKSYENHIERSWQSQRLRSVKNSRLLPFLEYVSNPKPSLFLLPTL